MSIKRCGTRDNQMRASLDFPNRDPRGMLRQRIARAEQEAALREQRAEAAIAREVEALEREVAVAADFYRAELLRRLREQHSA
jgi:hypothetical protein